MHPVIYLNKSLVEAQKARIAPVSSALLYGRGVFSTVAIFAGRPFRWSQHWARLEEHAGRLSIDCSELDEGSMGSGLKRLISLNKVRDGRARVNLLARSGLDIWKMKASSPEKTDVLIMTAESRPEPSSGSTLAVSPYRVNTASPLVGIKSLNNLERVLSWEEAQGRDFDDAVMLNERGEIVSATQANIFWTKDGTLYTPSLSCGVVAGITRAATIELANKLFIPVIEGVYELSDLTEADEIFLTSSAIGIAVVTTFDFRQYSVATGSIAARLRTAFRDLVST